MRKKITLCLLFLVTLLFTHQPEAKKEKLWEADKMMEMQLLRQKYIRAERTIEEL